MDHLLNLRAISKRMEKEPSPHKLYNFFDGATKHLDGSQIKEIKKIIAKDNRNIITFLDKVLAERKKEKVA